MFAEGYTDGDYEINAQIVGIKGSDETTHN